MAPDPFDLNRFVRAQAGVYAEALAELRAGRKRSHWMWFVFPQIAGLGLSATAQRYAIRSVDEARAYLVHPVLGPRLRECADALLVHAGRSALDILGSPDDLKLRSSATLFGQVAEADSPFHHLLRTFFEGCADDRTVAITGLPPP